MFYLSRIGKPQPAHTLMGASCSLWDEMGAGSSRGRPTCPNKAGNGKGKGQGRKGKEGWREEKRQTLLPLEGIGDTVASSSSSLRPKAERKKTTNRKMRIHAKKHHTTTSLWSCFENKTWKEFHSLCESSRNEQMEREGVWNWWKWTREGSF